jgi:class 3 adenylate cyclase/DNA-binding winged helix-turn-helix (wHTH) protein/tetratricopeptide (TPR) repeat protein
MSSPQWRFADFHLDPDNACLWRGTQPIALTPKAFDVLHYLVTHPDRLVTKDALLDAVWPELAISDAVVRIAIGELRRVLGDTAQSPRFIATVHRRGYRFVSPVTAYTEDVPGPASPVPPAIPQSLLVTPPGAADPPGARVRSCFRCQHPNPDEAQFCTACATPLALRCPTCGQDNLPSAAFCQACATVLASTLPAPAAPSQDVPVVPSRTRVVHPPDTLAPLEAERRQLTVLFCDLVDSTMLAGRLDPEDYREVVRAYHQTCAAVIQQYGGYIAQYLGDGILVYFGYPQAHEDDAQRAVRTGLGILHALGSLNTRLSLPPGEQLTVRLGIHTGLVVVGNMGAGARQEPLALGETPNLAARLQALAAPNTLVISAATWQLLGGFFVCQALGPKRLHGRAQPLEVYQVLSETTARSRLEAASRTGLTPLVGREQEIGLLRERWAQVQDGLGQVVLLSGEAGIGKSRLVLVLQEHIAAEPQAWLTPCQCSPYYQHSALYPLIDLLERVILRFERGESSEQKLHKLEELLVRYRLPLAEAVPLLAVLLSFSPSADYAPLTMSPAQQKQQTLHTLLMLLLHIAAQQPVLFVMEDLHWADPSTLELLSLLVDQAPTARILVLFTFRPDFRPPWTGRSYLTQVTLSRLTRRQAVEMTGRLVRGKVLPAEVVEQVVAKTDGVPLFVEELTKMVLESGWLREQETHYELTSPLPPLAIPTTIHDSLLARLDHLGTVKGMAQLGATLGREFSYDLLRAVAPWDEETLQQGLHQLVEAEFLYQRGLLPQATYLFKHVLIQDAAYQSLLKSTRQQYHQQIAQVLETQFPETVETQPELLAHHYTEASLNEQAVAYWQRAGQRASERSAYQEAMVCFEQALKALQHLPETRAVREQAIELRLDMRRPLARQGEFGRALNALQEAATLAEILDDRVRLAYITSYIVDYFRVTGDYDHALSAGQRALDLAETLKDGPLQAMTYEHLGVVHHMLGDYRQATEMLRRSVSTFESVPSLETVGMADSDAIESRARLILCLAEIGAFAEGILIAEKMVHMAEMLNQPVSLARAYCSVGVLRLLKGDLSQAIPILERSLALCHAWNVWDWHSGIASALGYAYTLCGRVEEALPLLEQTVERSQRIDSQIYLAETYLRGARLDNASTVAIQVLERSRERHEQGNETLALWLLGDIAMHRNPLVVKQAEAYYHQALALAKELGMRPLQAHCHRSLGTLYAKTGQREQALAELSASINLYRAMDMTFWLSQTEAALAQVEG